MRLLKYVINTAAILLIMGISDCHEKEPQPKTELEKLPPITQEGKYTFGCLVNGKAMVPDNTLDVSATHQLGSLVVLGRVQNDGISQALVFYIESSNISEKSYSLDDKLRSTVRYVYSDKNIKCDHNTDGAFENTGVLIITKLDPIKLIISGTFSLVITPPGCQKFTITDGRFDLKFIP